MIAAREGVQLDPSFLFDVQIKRLHEYKRQLMNGLSIMDIYLSLKDGSLTDFTPTVFLFGAKAAPGYQRAKAIIRYLNRVAKRINTLNGAPKSIIRTEIFVNEELTQMNYMITLSM